VEALLRFQCKTKRLQVQMAKKIQFQGQVRCEFVFSPRRHLAHFYFYATHSSHYYRQSTFTCCKNAHARAVTQAQERHKNGVTKEGAAAGSMSVKLAANCVCVIKYLRARGLQRRQPSTQQASCEFGDKNNPTAAT
jgi:hypothetical protein